MMLQSKGALRNADQRSVTCKASARGKGSSKPGSSSHHGSSGGSSTSSAAKLSQAAKAAAKRAAVFTQQRQQRALELAHQAAAQQHPQPPLPPQQQQQQRQRQQQPSSNGLAPAYAAAAAGLGSAPSPEPATDLRPYVEVITEHLTQQQGGGSSGSSGSSGGRGRGAKRGAARSLLESHTAVFQAALDLELQQEWKEAEDRLQSWPLSRLSAEGVALFGLAAAPDGGVARDVCLKFFLPNRPLPFHSFSQGDILLVSQGDPLGDSHEAVVVDSSSRWIRLALNPKAAAAVAAASGGWRASNGSNGSSSSRRCIWRLDLFANTVSHERCSEGLQRFAAAVVQGLVGGQDRQGLTAGQLTQGQMQQQEVLCRVLAGVMPPGTSMQSAAAASPPWFKSPRGRERLAAAKATVKGLVNSGQLNPSQATAIQAALTRTLTLWQGPPGTGKTTTLLRFCEAALLAAGGAAAGGPAVLAVAASNVAVDQLVGGLLGLGVKVVRLGQPVKVTPALRAVTLEVLAAATAPGQAAAKLRQQLMATTAAAAAGGSNGSSRRNMGRRGGSSSRSGSNGSSRGSSSGSGGQGLWEQILALEAAAAAEVLGGAQVVAATCVGAGDPVLRDRHFPVCVLDEATQAQEPAALLAAAQRVQSLVMVGDPRQLPPTVRSREAQHLGLGFSLFERVQAMGLKPLLLDTQYRMHPALAEFPAARFYQGLLRSWPKPSDRPLPQGLAWPNPKVPVMFVQVKGPEGRTAASISITRRPELDSDSSDSDDGSSSTGNSGSSGSSSGGYSYFNAREAGVVVGCVHQLLLAGLAPQDVCVITPYSGQVRTIQRMLAGSEGGRGSNRQQRASEGSQQQQASSSRKTASISGSSASLLEVKSVDGFQGREKEVVVFSAVRSNDRGRVGFLADSRRLNVALTRAKRGLVVVGDAETLRADRVWAAWLDWAGKQGVVTSADARLSAGVTV